MPMNSRIPTSFRQASATNQEQANRLNLCKVPEGAWKEPGS